MTPTKGILDPGRHSMVVFKEYVCSRPPTRVVASSTGALVFRIDSSSLRSEWGKISGINNNKRLNKTIREKWRPFKASFPKVPLTESISNIIELLQSQLWQGLVTKVLKYVGETKDVQDIA
ncbi:hypothetical protein J1N35_028170 [Gossypium stocksii]|uniref:Uncharacterized protein n=1 Tax=Gossypium stocksii TaxID=47602 RepID=A0A9D3UVN5_9ROSI|nr:hypothetical protein J1N35_028170 [Gossypium stocksii]